GHQPERDARDQHHHEDAQVEEDRDSQHGPGVDLADHPPHPPALQRQPGLLEDAPGTHGEPTYPGTARSGRDRAPDRGGTARPRPRSAATWARMTRARRPPILARASTFRVARPGTGWRPGCGRARPGAPAIGSPM